MINNQINKAIVKLCVNQDPINIMLTNESDIVKIFLIKKQTLSSVNIDLGTIEMQIDNVYEQKNFIKGFGVKLETQKTIPVIAAFAEVFF